jgi:tetratricopeptide (TPR) repeat protein
VDFARASGRDGGELAPRAAAALHEAAERALGLNAFSVAIGHAGRALESMPADDPARGRLLLLRGTALLMTSDEGEVDLLAARDAFAGVGDVDREAEAHIRLVDFYWRGRMVDRSLAHSRAAEVVGGRPPSPSKAFVLSQLSRFHMLAGRSDDAIALGREALAMAEALGLDEVRAIVLNNIGCARAANGDAGGVADLERSIEIAARIGSLETVRAHQNLASLLCTLGDMRRGRAYFDEARRLAEKLGNLPAVVFLRGERVSELYYAGPWEEAERAASEFVAASGSGQAQYLEPVCRMMRASIWSARGDHAAALPESARAIDQARQAADPQILYPMLADRARILLAAGERAEAEALADELLELGRSGPRFQLSEWLLGVTFVLVAVGRAADVSGLVPLPPPTPWAAAALALAAGEDVAAAEILHEIGSLPDELAARLGAVSRLAGAGRGADAAEQRSRAAEVARTLGVDHLLTGAPAARASA